MTDTVNVRREVIERAVVMAKAIMQAEPLYGCIGYHGEEQISGHVEEAASLACLVLDEMADPVPAPSSLAATPKAEPVDPEWFGVSGAVNETEALAAALFAVRCPGIRMTDEDMHYYLAAAESALSAVSAELDQPEATKSEPVRWTEDMERERREGDYERGFRDGQMSKPEAQKGEPDYTELKRLAEAASAGPWKASGTIYEHMNCEIRTGAKGEGQPIGQIWDGPNAFADGQFIAAASPQVVLGLIARASSPAPSSDELLEAISKDAAERVHKNGGCVPQLAYAPILFALQDGFAKHKGLKS